MNIVAISCSAAANYFSGLLDGNLSPVEQRQMDAHIDGCIRCTEQIQQMRQLRSTLRRMPVRIPPASLKTQLRVVASRELVRQKSRASVPAMWSDFRATFRLWSQNLMRPLAIPTAGGFLSAVVLFCLLPVGMASPSLALSVVTLTDVPTALYTDATIKSISPVGFNDQDVVVELTIDDQGRILSYTIPDCPHISKSPGLRRNIESSLLFTQFTPATTFGQPMSGKIRLSFRNSSIIVKG
ncbi:MAG: zf-HC2 domain-containing protein [Bryobacteraceae bacterium]